MQLYHITYYAALKKVAADFGSDFVPDGTNVKLLKDIIVEKEYDMCYDAWDTLSTLKYWKDFFVTKSTLIKFNVVPLKWANFGTWSINATRYNPVYCYLYPYTNEFKIYSPKNVFQKHYSQVSSDKLFGMDQLPEKGDSLIVTKSAKDVLVLYELGYNAVALQSETTRLKKSVYNYLKKRFRHVILLLDFDEAGKTATMKASSDLGIQYCFTHSEKCKDISEYLLNHKIERTKKKLKHMLSRSFTQK